MIKGKATVQRDTIHRPTVNYRELDALNVSMIKIFDTDPVKFFEQFKKGKKRKGVKNTSTIIGDLVDFYILDCKGDELEFEKRLDEKFALFEDNKGTGQAFLLADEIFEIAKENINENGEVTLPFDTMFSEAVKKIQAAGKYSNKSEEKILEDFTSKAINYYEFLVDNIDKTVIDESLIIKAKKVGDILLQDEFTEEIFKEESDDIELFPKFAIEFDYVSEHGKVIKCKSEIDLLKIDHNKKIIYPYDLKTTYDNENFEYTYLKFRYDLQAAFYTLAVQSWAITEGLNDYKIMPMEFIVGDTSSNNRRPVRYQLSEDDITRSSNGFSIRGIEYRGILPLIEEIIWSDINNMWNVSKNVYDNNGLIKLNLKYD